MFPSRLERSLEFRKSIRERRWQLILEGDIRTVDELISKLNEALTQSAYRQGISWELLGVNYIDAEEASFKGIHWEDPPNTCYVTISFIPRELLEDLKSWLGANSHLFTKFELTPNPL